MKKILILLSLVFVSVFAAKAQDDAEKKAMILRIGRFEWLETANPKEKEDYIRQIVSIVSDAATQSGRFEVLDDEIADLETQYFRREEFMDLDETKRKEMIGKAVNDYSLYGEVTKCKFTKRTSGAMGYTCVATVKVFVTNPVSGKDEIIASRTFASDFKKMVVKNSLGAALDDALQSMTPKMVSFFTNNFAVMGSVVKIQGSDVVISCGQPQGIKKGDEFQVLFTSFANDGTQTDTPVGIVKVKDTLADGTSICDIKSGKSEINEKFVASNTTQWLNCKLILK